MLNGRFYLPFFFVFIFQGVIVKTKNIRAVALVWINSRIIPDYIIVETKKNKLLRFKDGHFQRITLNEAAKHLKYRVKLIKPKMFSLVRIFLRMFKF